jgi:sugar lactone lactonase YvrE
MFPSRFEALAARARHVWRPAAGYSFALWLGLLCAALFSANISYAQSLEPGGPADMGAFPVGGSSANFTFTFSATVPTTISSVITVEEGAQNQDFILTPGATQSCTGTITPPHSCNINVTFTPKKIGFRRGAILILDNTGTVVNTQYLDGIGLAPQFSFSPVVSTIVNTLSGASPTSFKPSTSVYDGAGDLYFNDYQNGRLLKMDLSSNITTVGSFTGNTHSAIAINGAGTLYLTLPTMGQVEVIQPGVSNTVLSVPGLTLTDPTGIAVDGAGFLYIADAQQNQIVRVAPDGSGFSIVATAGVTLSSPFGLAVNHDFLYIADSGNGRIVEISLLTGVATGLTSTNALNQPYGIAADPSGTLIVADTGGSNIVSVSPTGTVTPLVADTGATLASLPLGVLVSTTGDVVSSDGALGLVFISRHQGSLTFPTPTKVGSPDSTDGYEALTVVNSGNQAIQFSASAPTLSDTDYAPGPTNTCPVQQATSTPLAIAASCTYTFGFIPSVIGPDNAIASIRGTSPTTGVAITGIADLNGTGVTPITMLSVVASPAATTPGTPVGFTVTALEGTTQLASFTGTVTFTMTDPSGVFLGGTSYTFTSADAGTHTFPATLGAEFNTPGTYTITAKYSTLAGTSNAVTVLYGSTTALTSSANPVPLGGQTTLSATVGGTGTAIVPTGMVTFYDGTTVVGTCTLSGGKCSYTPTLPVGPGQSLTAVYGGDNNFSPSTSNIINESVPGYTSTAALTSSINPSAIGQATTLTAKVVATTGQPNPPTLTGSVTFYDGTTSLAMVTLVNGAATYSATFTTPGSHSLTAVYSGDPNYAVTTSPVLAQFVGYMATTALTSSVNPSNLMQQTLLTATIGSAAGQPAPTGTVNFYDGATLLGTGTLVNGAYTLPASFNTPGTHSLTVVYSGDSTYTTLTSSPYAQVVNGNAATLTFTSSLNPAAPSQSFTLTATVVITAGQTNPPAPGGSVQFFNGANPIGSGTLVNGVATFATSIATAGSYPLKAVYSGDANYGTTSAMLTQVVGNLVNSQTTLTTSANPVAPNTNVNLTAFIAPVSGQTGTPTGKVSFYDGATLLGSVTVSGGSAVLPASFTTLGTHSLTAVYSGDSGFNASTSAAVLEVVNGFTATVGLSSSVNPSRPGQSTLLTATVAATAGQTNPPAPNGKVSFYDGPTLLGTSIANSGIATYTATFATSGTHPITAVYSGDTNFGGATSAALSQVVGSLYVTATSLAAAPNPASVGASVTMTASITVPAGQSNTTQPTGTVSFYDGSTLLGLGTVSNGTATYVASFATVGMHNLSAVYTGDTNFGTSTSANVVESITAYSAGITLASSINPTIVGQQTMLSSIVTNSSGQSMTTQPTGTVSFYDGAALLGTSTIVSGMATYPASFGTAGSHTLTAVYSGDLNYGAATSGALVQVVNPAIAAATVSLNSGQNPAYTTQAVVFTATVAPAANGGTLPTGMVTFLTGTSPIGTSALVNGVATISYTFLPLSTFPVTAVYSGDSNYATATSPIVNEVIEDFSFTLASPTGGSVTVAGGKPAAYTFTVTPIGGTTLAEAVNFTLSGFPSGATYSFSPATLAAGAGPTTVTLTLTPAAVAMLERDRMLENRSLPQRSRAGYAPFALALLVLPFALPFSKRRRPTALLLWLLLFVSAFGLTGCLSDPQSGYYGATPATFPLTVTATSGNLSRSATASLTRQ